MRIETRTVKRIYPSAAWGLVLAALLGLTLALLMLGAPQAAAQSVSVDDRTVAAEEGERPLSREATVVTATAEFSRSVPLLPQVAVITITAPPTLPLLSA